MRRSLHTMISIAKLSILALTLSFTVSAQNEPEKPHERLIHAGIVNGRAKSLPKPEYPTSAITERAAGQIKVDVVIDETGRVTSAEVIEGIENPTLREAAKTAALKAEFSPMTNGKPVKFKGTIVYNFAPPAYVNEEKRMIYGGVVNGKAKLLPAPAYPPSARQAGISGTVKVTVLIDETGRVVSAEASDAVENAALREVAEAAALKAEFSPTTLEGNPVKVKGTIVYNFVLESSPNEEKLKYMGFAIFLTTAKAFQNDLDKMEATFEGKDVFGDIPSELPQFAAELKTVSALPKVAPAQRKAVIDEAISAVESKVDASAKWQIAAGRELGGLMGPMMYAMASGESPEATTRYDVVAFRGHLSRLSELVAKAPSDLPVDVVRRLAEVAALHDREALLSPENVVDLANKIFALLDTISPDSK